VDSRAQPLPARPARRSGAQALLFVATVATLFGAGFFWAGPAAAGTGAALEAAVYAVWVSLILLAHEFGHYCACRHYGVAATLPFFVPGIPPIGTFGALIRVRGPIPHRRALFDIAAAGPIAGFAVALPALALGLALSEPFVAGDGGTVFRFGRPAVVTLLRPWLVGARGEIAVNAAYGAGWVGMLVTALNLFPVGQLDGGHAVYALSRRLHRWLSRAVPLALAALVLVQWLWLGVGTPAYLLWIAILLWMRDRHPSLVDPSGRLGAARRLVAALLALLFVLSFVAVPIQVVET
jgi:membrane-associated protease RseP (regulator of RpoE activity)